MPLLDALPHLKGAVQRSLPGGAPSVYMFSGGAMYAQSAAILACFPMPHILGDFSLAAEDLERALGRMPAEPTIGAGDGTLILKAGRLRSEITLMACEPPHGDPDGVNGWEPLPERLMDALRTVKEFVAKDGTWQRGARLEDDRIVAVSNRAACAADCPGLRPLGDTVLTDDCVEYLTGIKEPASEMCLAAGTAWFRWPSGAWVRCQMMALPWPEGIFDRITGGERVARVTPCELTQEWRDAFADAAVLGDGTITVRPGGLHGRTEHAEHLAEFATGAARETYWSLETLRPMFACAAGWNPDAEGPAYFAGDGVRGVVMGRRR